jgi:hypothetical protein
MTRIHRYHSQDDGERVGLPWQRFAPPGRERTSAARDPADSSPAAPLPSIDIGDVGDMTVDELTTAAAMLKVSPSSLLGTATTQAQLHADLDVASRLPAHLAELALSVAQLHPDTAATLLTAMLRRHADAPSAPERPAQWPSILS